MSNTEMNRQIVQEGLDRKKTARRQRMNDAAHDAAERQLRATINQHAQERREETEAAQEKERCEAEAQRQRFERMEARKAHEEEEHAQLSVCVQRIFGSLLFASLVTIGFTHEAIIGEVAIPVVAICTLYSIAAFVKYVIRNLKKKEVAA